MGKYKLYLIFINCKVSLYCFITIFTIISDSVAKCIPDTTEDKNVSGCRSTSGTHGYMAPEIYRYATSHEHGFAVDWFALGVCLHELVTGRRPFELARLQSHKYDTHCDGLYLDHLYASPPANSIVARLSAQCKDFVRLLLLPQVGDSIGLCMTLDNISVEEYNILSGTMSIVYYICTSKKM